MPLVTNRLTASRVSRFFSCSEMTKSNARSIASVSVGTCNNFCARLIFTASSRKCLCERVVPLAIPFLLPSEYIMRMYTNRRFMYIRALVLSVWIAGLPDSANVPSFLTRTCHAVGGSAMVGISTAKRISPMLAVADMEQTISFYESVLGFTPIMKSPEYSIVDLDGQTIHFMKAGSEEVMRCVRGHTEIYIEVSEIHVL